jgi:hypothetical protein
MDLITKLMLDITTDNHDDLPKRYYEAKQLVAKLGFRVKRIDCCVNDSKPKYRKKFGMNSEKKWNKAWNNVCNNFSRLNEMQLRRGREQHKGLFTSQNDNTRQSSSSQPQQSNHRNHPSSSRGYFAGTQRYHLDLSNLSRNNIDLNQGLPEYQEYYRCKLILYTQIINTYSIFP